ncbi:hypothetical protein ATZ33_17285 [Enterococcus silesiacus]|uniref:DUF2513 domain-containing protein n=1 Tax=Enterococcus silesiacus TaxID=332949 RepID=A0A0S3KFJ7_9ENTE|nr:DUF2513 domain-containing protein [Enterococcus silesiacus]ALS03067.1 hypothetical protein ATZ33_17285 [Enterococcus silesiacus]OJG93013.1 hypothetical protein RV15_GL002147 [Enterococcus silesiacus]
MRLNPDCIRDILLTVEEICDPNHLFDYRSDSDNEHIKNYDENTLYYHFRQADLSGLLYKAGYDMAGNFYAYDLTPTGHQFINDIRSDNNWKTTKSIASKAGSYSLDALKSIATGVITNIINQNLNS